MRAFKSSEISKERFRSGADDAVVRLGKTWQRCDLFDFIPRLLPDPQGGSWRAPIA